MFHVPEILTPQRFLQRVLFHLAPWFGKLGWSLWILFCFSIEISMQISLLYLYRSVRDLRTGHRSHSIWDGNLYFALYKEPKPCHQKPYKELDKVWLVKNFSSTWGIANPESFHISKMPLTTVLEIKYFCPNGSKSFWSKQPKHKFCTKHNSLFISHVLIIRAIKECDGIDLFSNAIINIVDIFQSLWSLTSSNLMLKCELVLLETIL